MPYYPCDHLQCDSLVAQALLPAALTLLSAQAGEARPWMAGFSLGAPWAGALAPLLPPQEN